MKRSTAIITLLVMLPFTVFFAVETWSALTDHFSQLAAWFANHKRAYYPWFMWVTAGAIIFPLMNKFWEKNIKFIKTSTHEHAHAIVAILLLQRVHSIHAEDKGSGMVTTSGNLRLGYLVTLAPYCFPFYTIGFMMLRSIIIPTYYPIIDLVIGFTIGLHIVCFKEQTGNYQPDIQKFPLWFSYSYIAAILVFITCLLLTAFLPTVNIFTAFKVFALDLWQYLSAILK